MNSEKLKRILADFSKKKIMVIGDLMLDHYIWGSVDRISPEAPVPVVDVKKEEYRLGGAANVVLNIKSLGAEPVLIGIAGSDNFAEVMQEKLQNQKISTEGILNIKNRQTTVKTRVIAHQQQVVRVDFEEKSDIDALVEKKIIDKIKYSLNNVDAIIIEDYNKGLLTDNLIKKILDIAKKNNIIVTVDPKFKNFFSYEGCFVFKPNFVELQKNMGVAIESEEQFREISQKLLSKIKSDYLIVTRGEKGLTIFGKDETQANIPTFAQDVFDVSGAGDTVISTLTLCLSCNQDIATSATIANHAAGKVCGKVGIYPATQEDILSSFSYHAK